MIASPDLPSSETVLPPTGRVRTVPPHRQPELGTDRVLLFIHGHSSRLEEAVPLVPHIHELAAAYGHRFAVIAMDLPSCGYTTRLDHEEVEPFDSPELARVPGAPTDWRFRILEFYEHFLSQFVRELDERFPVAERIATVMGGSLGGNLSLRLANPFLTPSDTKQWLHNRVPTFVSWSAAGMWDSFKSGNDFFKDEAVRTTRDNSRKTEPDEASYMKEVYSKEPGIALRAVLDVATGFLGSALGVPAQAVMWFRDDWPCKGQAILGSQRDREEIYDLQFERWHWRVAYEQLMFSHRLDASRGTSPSGSFGGPLYSMIQKRILVLAGQKDNYKWANIHDATLGIVRDMETREQPGRAFLLRDTGHSIHAERPRFLATQIIDFLSNGDE